MNKINPLSDDYIPNMGINLSDDTAKDYLGRPMVKPTVLHKPEPSVIKPTDTSKAVKVSIDPLFGTKIVDW